MAAATGAALGTRIWFLQPGHSAAIPAISSEATSSFPQLGQLNENSLGKVWLTAFLLEGEDGFADGDLVPVAQACAGRGTAIEQNGLAFVHCLDFTIITDRADGGVMF